MRVKIPKSKYSGKYPAKYLFCTLTTHLAKKVRLYYNKQLRPLGITSQQLVALGVLCFEEKDLSLGEFAKIARLKKSSAVSMIKRLEAMGLVKKEPHPSDARLVVLKVTDNTLELLPKLHEKVQRLEKHLETQIGSKKLLEFVENIYNIWGIAHLCG
ncbi:Transcriptional regulator, MarR family [uncultured Desulfobacterium sp.]|uniref:Transcriptional regulator, MarR family n=1 Tax=uncultured Desulfobacterium sp. TaxID=201089 RepID=A0A445MR19_9BACT|nr:Transcriptional regulator, MarR family [uncultured Desulfobacterium sp.]